MVIELRISTKNNYPFSGLLIKGASPMDWLKELNRMGLNLTDNKVYPIPNLTPNSIYGCLVECNLKKINEIGNNEPIQLIRNSLFIPQFTDIFPNLLPNEFDFHLGSKKHFFHPSLGLIELSEFINWEDIVAEIFQKHENILVPIERIQIPENIKAIKLDFKDDEEAFNEFLNPDTEEDKLEKLPFDMKKLMAGNEKEMAKYLKYLEENPEKALKYAPPLDVFGTSRGKNDGKFSFKNEGFFDKLINFFDSKSADSRQSSNFKSRMKIIGVIAIGVLITILIVRFLFNNNASSVSKPSSSNEKIIEKVEPNTIDTISTNQDLFYNNLVLTLFFITISFQFLYLILNKKISTNTIKKNTFEIIFLILGSFFLIKPFYQNNNLNSFFAILLLFIICYIFYNVFNNDKDSAL